MSLTRDEQVCHSRRFKAVPLKGWIMNRLPPRESDYECEFNNWRDQVQQHMGPMSEDARLGWYAAAACILDKLEDQRDVAMEFDNTIDIELLNEQIEYIQEKL